MGRQSSSNNKPVTIVDVARAAGVSHSTVSRVLNGRPHIKTATRERVEKAVENLGYVANMHARRLAGGQTGVVGFLVLRFETPYTVELVRSVDSSLADRGLDLMLCTTHRREELAQGYVEQLATGLVDGLIVFLPAGSERYAENLSARGFPFVLLDHEPSAIADSVIADNGAGIRMTVEHLLELGHRRIAFITGRLDGAPGIDRLEAYRRALADNGLDVDSQMVLVGDYREQTAFDLVPEILAAPQRPTAVVTSADTAAFGVIRGLQAKGLKVPRDMSVVGFDDIPAAELRQLTTVRQPTNEIGRRAVQLLSEQLEQPRSAATHIQLPVELVVRSSTGPPSHTAR